MAGKVIGEDEIGLMKGIKPGYAISFDPDKKTVRFVNNRNNQTLYFDALCPDDKYNVGFIRDKDDFRHFVIFLACINGLEVETCGNPENPSFIFFRKPRQTKARRTR